MKTNAVTQYNPDDVKDRAKEAVMSTVSSVQDGIQSGLAKNLKNVQKSVRPGLAQTQDTLLTGLSAAQVALAKNAKRASKNLKNAQENLRDTRDALQSQLKKRARRRARARAVFRLGILTGVGLMLLYAPWPGSETRRQLVAFWQGLIRRQD